VIAVRSKEEWQGFCNVINKPELITDAKFSTLKGRKENEDELDSLIEQWALRHTPEEVMFNMQKAGVPTGIVKTPKDVLFDPQLKHRRHFHWMEHSIIGSMPYHGQSFKLSKTPEQVTKNAPCLGEDNEYVYKEILGYSDDEISDMLAEGVITVDTGEHVSTLL